ncbi:3'-5' exonuclease, partial [Neobacillus niacini]|uniref:3'-5' exonuclease n=1 Tax=Neobacillus niacini TaxID=86668 RepID=UPI002FFFFD28
FNHVLEKEKKSLYVEWFQLKGAKIYAEHLKEHIDNMKKEAFLGDFTSIHPLLNNKIMNQIYDRVKDLPYNDMYSRTIIFIQQLFDLKSPENSTELVSNFKKYWNVIRKSVNEVYTEFLQKEYLFSADRNNLLVQLSRNQREYYEEDIPALVYTSFLLDKPNNIQNFDHIFIDEAQDINYIQFLLLKTFCPTSSFTIVGDLNQQIYLQRGIGSWENLKPLFDFNFMSLEYNYRSSKEIMDLATSCLIKTDYKGTGILETGVRPIQYFFNKKTSDTENWLRIKKRYLADWLLSKQSIAIITNSIEDSEKIEESLYSIGLLETNVIRSSNSTLDHSKITIISSLQVKGLEFNHVLLYNPSEKEYPADNYFSKLLYMVMTRALYNLVLLIIDNPTSLLEEADLNYLCQNVKE